MALVYMATNKINGKRYIGMTRQTMEYRRSAHYHRAETGIKGYGAPRISAAIRKYGRDAFEWCVLETDLSIEGAKQKEIELIALLKPEYNVTKGGDGGGNPAWNRKKIICLNDGRIFESATAAAHHYGMSQTCPGDSANELGTMKGLHFEWFIREWTAEERTDRIALRNSIRVQRRKKSGRMPKSDRAALAALDTLGRRTTGPYAMARQVECLDDGRVFPSASSAADTYGVPKSGVIELCLGKRGRKTIGGLRFRYVETTSEFG